MTKYHVNDNGDPGPCNAIYKCRFASSSEHYDTPEEARKAYEKRQNTFDNSVFIKKRKKVFNNPTNTFNEEGLTEKVSEFRKVLQDTGRSINNYMAYRRTGLNEDEYVPNTPNYINSYINPDVLKYAWKSKDKSKVRDLYLNAIKSFYMEKVFTSSDIDVLFSDEEIEEFISNPGKHFDKN